MVWPTCLAGTLSEDAAVEGGLAVGGVSKAANQQDGQGHDQQLTHSGHHLGLPS